MRAWIVLVALSGCFITPVQRFGGGKSRQQVVHEQAAQLTPSRVQAVGTWSGDVATRKLRVWADDDYRAQNVRWQQGFQELLDDANEILAAQFGIRLVAEYQAWEYRAAPGASLEDTLRALGDRDPAGDAFVVIGLTSSISLVTAAFDKLGLAQLPGRYLVIRGYADLHEREALELSFSDLRKEERVVMFEARRHHKRLALVLHELGHVFGAAHVDDPTSLLHPAYSVQAVGFDAASRAAITAGLDGRLGRTTARQTEAAPSPPSPPPPPPPPRPPLVLDPADRSPVIVVTVDREGRRTIDGKQVFDAQLDGVFLLAVDRSKRTRLYIRIEPGSPPEVVKDITTRATKAGLAKVIVTSD